MSFLQLLNYKFQELIYYPIVGWWYYNPPKETKKKPAEINVNTTGITIDSATENVDLTKYTKLEYVIINRGVKKKITIADNPKLRLIEIWEPEFNMYELLDIGDLPRPGMRIVYMT